MIGINPEDLLKDHVADSFCPGEKQFDDEEETGKVKHDLGEFG
jgi:hypothetical protein